MDKYGTESNTSFYVIRLINSANYFNIVSCIDSRQAKQSTKNKLVDVTDYKRKLYGKQSVNKLPALNNSRNSQLRIRAGSSYIDLRDKRNNRVKRGPMYWYLEDEIAMAKDALWKQKQKIHNEEMNKNIQIGKKRVNLFMKMEMSRHPRWYQDFSIDQCVIQRDCEERVSGRTERTLTGIGVISTFFILTPNVIKKLQEISKCNAIEFLRETYKVLTGNYFEEEGHKQFYDCNERIILSAIAFLTLPEAILELHERLPSVTMPEIPHKPLPPTLPIRQKKASPYKEELFVRPDWASYYNLLQSWRAHNQVLPIPKVILPPKECVLITTGNIKMNRVDEKSSDHRKRVSQENFIDSKPYHTKKRLSTPEKHNQYISTKEEGKRKILSNTRRKSSASVNLENTVKKQQKENIIRKHSIDERNENAEQEINTLNVTNKEKLSFDVPQLPNGSKVFDFTINGVSEKRGPVEYKICGVLQPPKPHTKSWLDEKHAHYIISGAADNPPSCPITYEMTGVANVTPTNSNEKFFAILKLGDGPNKIYPSGRKNLSPKWQEWLQNTDEEFRKVEREANKLIKSIEAITKVVFPGPKCDNCCSCRQSRKSYLKAKGTRTPYFVIDTIAEDSKKNKCIIGSMAMHSPAPTPPESTINLLEVIASEDVLTSKLMINGITNPKGETQYFISGIKDEIVRRPARIIERPPPRPPRNVPPCECAIQQVSSKGYTSELSHDHIPWTKEEGLCFGNKFRPHEAPALSCKMYPGDKSCRRNPFFQEIMKIKRRAERAKKEAADPSGKKRMYSIADFQPCGDEHGMSICGAPWGTLHTLTPQELEEAEKLRKQILRGPPCGTKPGSAVCKGPFGERVPFKKPTVELKEISGEFDEEDLEEEEEEERKEDAKPGEAVKEKEKRRDQKCLMSPDSLAVRQRTMEKEVTKFVPDPLYPGYDDAWNIHRTAPTEKESETDFKALLKLSSPKPPATPVESKLATDYHQKSQSSLHKNDLETKQDKQKKNPPSKVKINGKLNKQETKSIAVKGTQGTSPTSPVEKTINSRETKDYKALKPQEPSNPQTRETKRPTTSNRSNLNVKSDKNSLHNKPSKNTDTKTKPVKESTSKRARNSEDKTSKRNRKSKIEDVARIETSKKIRNPRKSSSIEHGKKKETKVSHLDKKKHKKKDTQNVEDAGIDLKKQILNWKNALMSPENYPYNVQPVDLPKDPPTKCAHEYEDTSIEDVPVKNEEETSVQLPSKGPCGWKTKSEQQLPTKKTLVYLAEPDYPPETIKVRPGGKPCVCRENKAKKKILMYNIGGLLGGKKDDTDNINNKLLKKKKDEDEKKLQVIDGIIYHTPPPSPRRSDEYVPEYDLYDSPYDMCLSKRTDENLKYFAQFSVPSRSTTKILKRNEPCECNESVDTHGTKDTEEEKRMKEDDKKREALIEALPPTERWQLALKDRGLLDYYTRCRDSMPCWLKCGKFNKVGCRPPSRKLKVKRPVCECKYERKILENKEEKMKWKERRERLKSLKKQPFVNVVDTSKPVIADTKLMISGVKRIPKEDEYIDDVKYCITGVVENYTEEPPKPIVGGVHMATPIQTPEPSVEQIPCVCLHRHWSPINIPPGPLPKPEEIKLAEEKRRKEAVEEAYRQIHVPDSVYDTHGTHGCSKPCHSNTVSEDEDIEESDDTTLFPKQIKQRRKSSNISKSNKDIRRSKLQSISKIRTSPQRKMENYKNKEKVKNISPAYKTSEERYIQRSRSQEVANLEKTDPQKIMKANVLTKSRSSQGIRSKGTKSDSHLQSELVKSNKEFEENTDKEEEKTSDESYLMSLVKGELRKMATEGFLFAKLPACFQMPQVKYWVMYMEGIALTDTDRSDSVRKSIMMWNQVDAKKSAKSEPPLLDMTKVQLGKLTFNDAERMKEQVCSYPRQIMFLLYRSFYSFTDWKEKSDIPQPSSQKSCSICTINVEHNGLWKISRFII
nr:uncharacterized protein LOC116431397 isoform X2 [Nomia melanderi]